MSPDASHGFPAADHGHGDGCIGPGDAGGRRRTKVGIVVQVSVGRERGGVLPPQGGVLGAQQGVFAAESGDLAVASAGGVALPPARLPDERLGGATASGVGGVGLYDELGQVRHSEDEVQRPEVVHPARREIGGQLAVGLALAPLMLARRARAAAAAGRHVRPPLAGDEY